MIKQEMNNKRVVIFWNKGSILHTIICLYILYEFCIQIVYIIFTMYTFCRSELMSLCIPNLYKTYLTFRQTFVYKISTKFIQNVYLQNVSHISTNFCIQNVYKISEVSGCHLFRQMSSQQGSQKVLQGLVSH